MKYIYELQRIDICGRRYTQRRTNIVTMGYFSTQENAVDFEFGCCFRSATVA